MRRCGGLLRPQSSWSLFVAVTSCMMSGGFGARWMAMDGWWWWLWGCRRGFGLVRGGLVSTAARSLTTLLPLEQHARGCVFIGWLLGVFPHATCAAHSAAYVVHLLALVARRALRLGLRGQRLRFWPGDGFCWGSGSWCVCSGLLLGPCCCYLGCLWWLQGLHRQSFGPWHLRLVPSLQLRPWQSSWLVPHPSGSLAQLSRLPRQHLCSHCGPLSCVAHSVVYVVHLLVLWAWR
jgi:hypothetical protein